MAIVNEYSRLLFLILESYNTEEKERLILKAVFDRP